MIAVEKSHTVLQVRALHADGAFHRRGEPVCVGLPLPRGLVTQQDLIQLSAIDAGRIAVQRTVLERWGDGSIRWLVLEFQASTDSKGNAEYDVTVLSEPAQGPPLRALQVDEQAQGVTINTNRITVSFRKDADIQMGVGPEDAARITTVGVVVEDSAGRTLRPRFHEVAVEAAGPLTAQIRMSGAVTPSGSRRPLNVVLRVKLFEGMGVLAASLTVHNPSRATHRGGTWELGDPGSILLRDVSARLTLAEGQRARQVRYSESVASPWCTTSGPVRIYQDSSGGEQWNSQTHVTRDGGIGPTFRGYEVTADGLTRRGQRATPAVQLQGTDTVSLTMAHFWENFPKAVEADERSITLRLFPGCSRTLHEIQGGERKRHDFTVCLGGDPVTAEPLAWARLPLVVSASPTWYRTCETLPFLIPLDVNSESDAMVQTALDGAPSFGAKRERADEYGWRHFGDLYADHEAVHADGGFVSHYNNQYDPICGFARQFLRTGDTRWYDLMASLARHVADIDIYHTAEDKSAYNGGLFWHTFHYVDAGKSNHRSYPAAPGVNGGGPSCEHNYAEGLGLHYLLTGDVDSKEAVFELADWVVSMDDGRRNAFAWLDGGRTGWASATGSSSYHGPGRGAGNSIATLLTAARFSASRVYLQKAEELIRRCVHPADDPAALDLLDAERRWSYTVFLQVLGRYLLNKIDRNELDGRYAYARESLMAYARWMAQHEVPYLDKPERLDHPTETWVAQDLRKAEVFVLAWLCAEPAERDAMRERAEFFFARSIATLRRMPTRSLTRPLALLMSYTGSVPWMREHAGAVFPDPESCSASTKSFDTRQVFVPQRTRAIRRAKAIGVALVAVMVIALIGLAW